METKTLSEKNIQDLYKFTRQHFVEHYDVQSELVDHLANDIEEIWKENPKFSFEQARDKSFKKFGIFGFLNVVEEKQKQIGKRYYKILWQFVKEWFQLPKIALTITIFLFFYYCLQFKTGMYILGGIIFILGILDVYFATKLNKKLKAKKQKWMLEEYIYNIAAFGGIMVASNLPQFLTFSENHLPSHTASIFIALLITVTVIYSYISLAIIPKKAEELLEETYPEYKIAKSL